MVQAPFLRVQFNAFSPPETTVQTICNCHGIAKTSFIPSKQDEQEREITMKSSSIALRWLSPKNEAFLVTGPVAGRGGTGFLTSRLGDRRWDNALLA